METEIILSQITTALGDYALGDIKSTQKNEKPIAAFILCTCFIDQVSGYAYDNTKKGYKTNTDRSKMFITDYLNAVSLKPYNSEDLVELLRNKLVHNYSVGDTRIPNHRHYALEYSNPSCHLLEDGNKVYINIQAFIDDIEKAWLLYKEKLLSNVEVQRVALEHYKIYGILVFQQIEINIS